MTSLWWPEVVVSRIEFDAEGRAVVAEPPAKPVAVPGVVEEPPGSEKPSTADEEPAGDASEPDRS